MTLHIYNGEIFKRDKRRYIFFSLVIIIIIGLSLWKWNIVWVVVLFFILGAYFYYGIIANQTTTIKIEKEHLIIDKKEFLRGTFIWYCLEIEKGNNQIKNIVFITEKKHIIYTINDKKENIKNFLVELNNFLPILPEFNQTSLEKLVRLLKL